MPLTSAANNAAGAAFPLTSPEYDRCLSRSVLEEVVQIAADCASRQKIHRKIGMFVLWRRYRQQPQLHLARHRDVALQLLLLPLHRLVEPCVFDRDRNLRGHGRQHPYMIFIEKSGARMLQVENADDAIFVEERNDQLRPRLSIHGQITLILEHVRHIDRTPLAHRRTHQPRRHRDAAQGACA